MKRIQTRRSLATVLFGAILAMGVQTAPTSHAFDGNSKKGKAAIQNSKSPVATTKQDASLQVAETQQVDLFNAMENKLVDVRFVGKNSMEGIVILRNETDKPIDLVLPKTFGAAPVLAQPGPGFQQAGFGNGNGRSGGGNQNLGSGFGAGGNNNNFGANQNNFGANQNGFNANQNAFGAPRGGGNGNGFFRVEPDKPRKITVATVCLNFGKPDPNPHVKYELVRLKEINDSPELDALCASLADKQVTQNVAQAVAWHIANGLEWEQLANVRVASEYTGPEYLFTQNEVRSAMEMMSQIVVGQHVASQDKTAQEYVSPGYR